VDYAQPVQFCAAIITGSQGGTMKTGDKVTRKWKPQYGSGEVLHILGDKIVVKWYGFDRPKVIVESPKYLKVIDEGR
jgi:hypothetical protein